MRRIFFGVALAIFSLLVSINTGRAQELLPDNGYGSLSGKVTLDGPLPAIVDLTEKMKIHADKTCCLNAKATALEKIDQTWLVDPKSKGVANVVIWAKAPDGKAFPIHEKFQKRKDTVVIDQPHCAFLPRVSAINPVYFDGNKNVKTGQTLIIKNSATVPHNVRATGHPVKNEGFNVNVPAQTEITKTFNPQLLPISLQCDVHSWMAAKLFVFDHPYYAITKADGTFEIPMLPAGAQITIMAWHEGTGWALKEGKAGRPIMIEAGKKHTLELELKVPAER